MKCPECQAEMVERATAYECPNRETRNSGEYVCTQVPICKGCLEPQISTGAPIWEYFCGNPDCLRTPQENLKDLFDPKFQQYNILDFTNGENQKTINHWVHECFPEWSGPRGRALAVVEEAVELALATGLTQAEIQSAVELPIMKELRRVLTDPNYKPEPVEGEIADTLINVLAYAEEVKVDAHKAMNAKMKTNRSRPKEHYLAKTEEKKKLGLKLKQ